MTENWKWDNSYRIFVSKSNKPLAKRIKTDKSKQIICCYTNKDGNKRYFRTDYNKKVRDPRIELVQAEANSSVFIADNWTDISNDGRVAQEGTVIFPKGKKPERIIQRVISSCTSEGDLVLDSFLGSRVIIMTEANSSVKSKGLKLLPKLKTEELIVYVLLRATID